MERNRQIIEKWSILLLYHGNECKNNREMIFCDTMEMNAKIIEKWSIFCDTMEMNAKIIEK